MWIDLGLEGIQFALPLFLLLRNNILHKLPDLGYGGLKGLTQMGHLQGTAHIDIGFQIACLPLFHGIVEFL